METAMIADRYHLYVSPEKGYKFPLGFVTSLV